MRALWLAGTILALGGLPVAVADATPAPEENPPMCGAPASATAVERGSEIRMVAGFGDNGFAIDTDNPEAQAWFNYGMRLRWAFEHTEAVRAFQKARALDPECGMCAWGQAYAMGANLNYDVSEEAQGRALTVAKQARRLSRDAEPWQKAMVDVLARRYSGRAAGRNLAYADAMERVQRRWPRNTELAALTADALLIADDDWFDAAKRPSVRTARALGLMEGVLAVRPNDPAAIHLYIHTTEYSTAPEKAVPYADRLARLAPGSPHLIHMPSHTYYRIGRYKDAATSNIGAVAAAKRYDAAVAPPGGLMSIGIHRHNLQFGLAAAQISGNGPGAVGLANDLLAAAPVAQARQPFSQIVAGSAFVSYGLFEPARLAGVEEPAEGQALLRIMWRYARGEAAYRAGDERGLARETTAMRLVRRPPAPDGGFGQMLEVLAQMPLAVLEGRSSWLAGDYEAAAAAFDRAADLQESVDLGLDPPAWWFPVRRSQGAALLKLRRYDEARTALQAALARSPRDPTSLFVLSEVFGRRAAPPRPPPTWRGRATNGRVGRCPWTSPSAPPASPPR